MSFDVDVDQIVREVLARLRDDDADNKTAGRSGPGTSGGRATSAPATNASASTATQSAAADRLVLTERLVTLATLENRLSGIRHVVLPRGAVVTPAARDALADRRIGTSYAAGAEAAGTRSAPQPLVVGCAGFAAADRDFDRTALFDALSRDGLVIERLADSGLPQVVAELADHAARGGRTVLLLTREPAAAACVANRSSGVRAVAASHPAGLPQALASTGANFLALDPVTARHAARRMILDFYRGAPRPVPPLFEKGVRNLFHAGR